MIQYVRLIIPPSGTNNQFFIWYQKMTAGDASTDGGTSAGSPLWAPGLARRAGAPSPRRWRPYSSERTSFFPSMSQRALRGTLSACAPKTGALPTTTILCRIPRALGDSDCPVPASRLCIHVMSATTAERVKQPRIQRSHATIEQAHLRYSTYATSMQCYHCPMVHSTHNPQKTMTQRRRTQRRARALNQGH